MVIKEPELQKILDDNCQSCSHYRVCYSHEGSVYHEGVVDVLCKNDEVKEAMTKLDELRRLKKS